MLNNKKALNLIVQAQDKFMARQQKKMRQELRIKDRDAGRLMRRAAEVLNDKDWTRGKLVGPDGSMCMIGVLNYTICGNPHPRESIALVNQTQRLFQKWHGMSIISFNDDLKRTKEEALEIMSKFADEFDAQGGMK